MTCRSRMAARPDGCRTSWRQRAWSSGKPVGTIISIPTTRRGASTWSISKATSGLRSATARGVCRGPATSCWPRIRPADRTGLRHGARDSGRKNLYRRVCGLSRSAQSRSQRQGIRRGAVHTNSIKFFRVSLKWGYVETYHKMSATLCVGSLGSTINGASTPWTQMAEMLHHFAAKRLCSVDLVI